MREIVGYAAPEDTREGLQRAIRNGASGMNVVDDLPTKWAVDPDHPLFRDDVGSRGRVGPDGQGLRATARRGRPVEGRPGLALDRVRLPADGRGAQEARAEPRQPARLAHAGLPPPGAVRVGRQAGAAQHGAAHDGGLHRLRHGEHPQVEPRRSRRRTTCASAASRRRRRSRLEWRSSRRASTRSSAAAARSTTWPPRWRGSRPRTSTSSKRLPSSGPCAGCGRAP